MKFTFRKAACLLAALCCLSACWMTGCSDEGSGTKNGTSQSNGAEDAGVDVYSPKVPANKIDEKIPGSDIAGELSKEVNYADKLTVKLDKVVELDAFKKADKRVLLAEMTITNNSGEAIDCSQLTHFSAKADGAENLNIVRDVSAAINGRKYYTHINSEMMSFNQKIEAGQSLSGYVYMGAPVSWKDLELVYIPYKYYSNDTVTFKITEEGITHYTEKLDGLQTTAG